MDPSNPSLMVQKAKLGLPKTVRTVDIFPFRKKFTSNLDWVAEFGSARTQLRDLCIDFSYKLLIQAPVSLILGTENSKIFHMRLLTDKSLFACEEVELDFDFKVVNRKPRFTIVRDASGGIKHLAFFNFHGSYFYYNPGTELGLFSDLIWNTVASISCVGIVNCTYFTWKTATTRHDALDVANPARIPTRKKASAARKQLGYPHLVAGRAKLKQLGYPHLKVAVENQKLLGYPNLVAARAKLKQLGYPHLAAAREKMKQLGNPQLIAAHKKIRELGYPNLVAARENIKRRGYPNLAAGRETAKQRGYPSLVADLAKLKQLGYPNLVAARAKDKALGYPRLAAGRAKKKKMREELEAQRATATPQEWAGLVAKGNSFLEDWHRVRTAKLAALIGSLEIRQLRAQDRTTISYTARRIAEKFDRLQVQLLYPQSPKPYDDTSVGTILSPHHSGVDLRAMGARPTTWKRISTRRTRPFCESI